jgi:hypothetical protein
MTSASARSPARRSTDTLSLATSVLPDQTKGKAEDTYGGEVPHGYFVYRSPTNNVFVFWRAFFRDPNQLTEPVELIEKTRIYPLGKKEAAKPMQFPDGSCVPVNMLFPSDGSYFEMLSRFIDSEAVEPADVDWRGMLAAIGIIIMDGETDQLTPYLFCNTTQVFPWVGKPDYNLTTNLADEAIRYLREVDAAAPEKPFFLYYVPGDTHAPHQPKQEWIDRFKGKFDMGWSALREQTFANQKHLGVIPEGTELTPWPDELPKWDTLDPDSEKLFARQAEVYAAYTDYEIGRVIDEVENLGKLRQHADHLQAAKFGLMCVATLTREQKSTEFSFEFLDRARQGGLGDVAHLRRLREIQRLAERQEVTNFVQLHASSRSCASPTLSEKADRHKAKLSPRLRIGIGGAARAQALFRHHHRRNRGNRAMNIIMAATGLASTGPSRALNSKVAVVTGSTQRRRARHHRRARTARVVDRIESRWPRPLPFRGECAVRHDAATLAYRGVVHDDGKQGIA